MAEDDDDASKTEEPSGRKLAKAREKGQVALSSDLRTAFLMVGTVFAVLTLAPPMARKVHLVATPFIEDLAGIPVDQEAIQVLFMRVAIDMALALWPIFSLLMVLAIVGTMVQTGLLWAPSKIGFKFNVLNPLTGLKRLFSAQQLVEFAKGIVKTIIVATIAFFLALPLLDDLELIPAMDIEHIMRRITDITLWLAISTVGVMVVIAGLDWFYQRFAFMKKMRMTKQEVKEEVKQSEGDPQIKAKIRSLRMQRARQRMMAAVPKASVVITNPTHYAVALLYKMDEMTAPRLVAKGADHLALRIRQVAEENEVPIVENPPLARALYASVELEDEIPPEHYKAVAEIIGYVMRLRGELPGQAVPPPAG